MKIFVLFLFPSLLLYSATIYVAPPTRSSLQTATKKPQENSPVKETPLPTTVIQGTTATKLPPQEGVKDMMIISPEGRAKDIRAAIKFLQQKAPSETPVIQLINGHVLQGIIDIDVMPGGTLLIFKITSLKGSKYRVEKIENIDKIIIHET